MALITRVRPQAGDAAITDIVTAGTFTGTGATLVDVGAEKAWNIPSGSTYNLSVPNKFVDSATDAQGVTFAVRFRVNNVGTGSFDQMFGMYSGGRGPIITKSGSSNMRGKTDTSGGAVLTAVTSGITFLAQTQTLVYRINTVAAGSDTGGLWIGGASRTGNLPNVSAGTGNIGSSVTISNALITALNSTNYDLLDFVYFDEELTDADCASLADDIVGYFGGGGPTAYSITAETVSDSHTTNDVTLSFSGAGTAYTLTADTVSDSHSAGDVTLTYNAAGTATITSEPLRDNTNTLLANQALDYVAIYDNTTGALVLRVTGLSTDASGIFSVSDAALTGGVTYRLDWKLTIQSAARMPAKAAV